MRIVIPAKNVPYRKANGPMGTYEEAHFHNVADYRIVRTSVVREAYFSPHPNRAERRRQARRLLGRVVSKPATRRRSR